MQIRHKDTCDRFPVGDIDAKGRLVRPFVAFLCPAHTRCTHAAHTLHTRCTLAAHTLHTRCTHAAHTLHTRCTLAAHTLHTRCTHAAHTLHTRCTLAAHTLHTRCTHAAHTRQGARLWRLGRLCARNDVNNSGTIAQHYYAPMLRGGLVTCYHWIKYYRYVSMRYAALRWIVQ